MTKRAWMPLYIADYIGDTQHLTTEEHGAYLLLIMAYWRQGGPLPDDDSGLRQITRIAPQRWPQKRDVLLSFFEHRPAGTDEISYGHYRHNRIDQELSKSVLRSESAKNSANQRWNAQKTDANAMLAREHSDGNASGMLPQPHTNKPANACAQAPPRARAREDAPRPQAGNGAHAPGRAAPDGAADLAFELAGMAGIALTSGALVNAAVATTQRWLDDGILPDRCRAVVAQCLANGQSGPTRSLKRFDAIIRADHARAVGAVYQAPPKPPPVEEQIRMFEDSAARMHAIGDIDAEVEFLSKAETLKLKVGAR